jgi:intein/homing endonuclease
MSDPIAQFLDVDFTRDPHYTKGYDTVGDISLFGAYEDFGSEMIPESEWKDRVAEMDRDESGCDSLVTRIYNQGREGSCFPPGTLVTMATGELRPIEFVSCLENVITAENNVGEVRQVMARPFIGQLVGIHLHGHNLVRATPEHPFLTNRGYVPACELTADDYVAIPRVRPTTVSVIQTASYLPHRHRCSNDRRIKRFSAPEGRTLTQIQIEPVPDMLELDPELGRIIGLFLAEGNCDKQKIVWTFNIDEKDTLVAELQELLKTRLGVESKVRIAGARCTAKVQMYGTLWARLFEGLCSSGSGRKRLCAELASGSAEFLRAVFDGWMAGDGCRQKHRNTGVTVSRELAVQMFQIATRLGMMPALRRSEPKPTGNVLSRMPRYDLTFNKEDPDGNYRRSQDENHCWRKVRLLTREGYNGPVYNLHVHGDESYIADGLGVHNCVANACAQSHEIMQAAQFGKANVTALSAISLYKRIGRSPGSGAMVSDGLKESKDRGILPLDNAANREHYGGAVMPPTGFYEKFPAGWEATALNFRVDEWVVIRSLEGMLSALLNRKPVVVGRQSHSICYCRPMYRSGSLISKYANSWGSWGDNGFGYDTLRQMSMSAGWAFAPLSIVIPKHLGG